jgi:PEP-CTERM motif
LIMYKMRIRSFFAGVALCIASASGALSATVSVSGFAGPWSVAANPSLDYGVGDNTAPTVLSLASGATSVTITYLSGLTSAFVGVPPTVDALGYVGGIFGSGAGGFTGIGSSGQPFPSFFIDPTNAGPPIYLAALIGDFTNSAGVVIGTPFAPGDGPFTISIPTGATELSLGINDDIYSDNSGALTIGVTGVSGVPEPSTWAMIILGFAGLGFVGHRKSRSATLLRTA